MLYKLGNTGGVFDQLDPVKFKDISSFGKKEKDLENLIANNILYLLFEDSSLMPIYQERQGQAKADIYALNENGDLIIFELKRGAAYKDAVHQSLQYSQEAGQWSYSQLEKKYQSYMGNDEVLIKAHQEAFNLEHALDVKEMNKQQHLIIIGSAADNSLISAVDYWKRKGLSIDFLPYRVYEISGESYFEFFALPYDKHNNPGEVKGVLFDTNRDVAFLTPVPKKGNPIKAMPFGKVSEITGKRFFWARTIKGPYLSKEEAENLLDELNNYLQKKP